MRGTYDCFYQLLHQIQRQKQSSKLSLATSSALPKQKKPEVLGKSAGPKLRMNTARKDEFARAQEDQNTQKLTVLLNRQG
jgi:hypothetical protein